MMLNLGNVQNPEQFYNVFGDLAPPPLMWVHHLRDVRMFLFAFHHFQSYCGHNFLHPAEKRKMVVPPAPLRNLIGSDTKVQVGLKKIIIVFPISFVMPVSTGPSAPESYYRRIRIESKIVCLIFFFFFFFSAKAVAVHGPLRAYCCYTWLARTCVVTCNNSKNNN